MYSAMPKRRIFSYRSSTKHHMSTSTKWLRPSTPNFPVPTKNADSSKKILVSWATGPIAASTNQKTPLKKAEIFREPAATPRQSKAQHLAPAAHSRPFLRARRCALCKSAITEKTQRKNQRSNVPFFTTKEHPPTSLPAALAKPRQPRAEGLHEN